jgi:hypothetical protein
MDFRLSGRRFNLTRQQVIEALKGVAPEPVRTYGVRVDSKLYPCKQALATATGLPRACFNSHQAYRVLEKLGLNVVAVEDWGAGKGDLQDLP